jgi:UDP-N-acetylmuramoylalanine--D-glutamate ligase
VICEASSFQLEDTVAFAPEVALLLNIEPDHLDRHGTMEDYLAAKLRIFARQGPDDVAIGPPELLAQAGGRGRRVTFGPHWDVDLALRDGMITWQGADVMRASDVRIRGAHNLENAMGAAAAALSAGIEPEAVAEGLRSFPGVEHRIEDVAVLDGILWVNDSKATNVASTRVALDAFTAPVHLILGGQGKGQDFAPLRDPVAIHVRTAYLIGEDAAAIADALGDATEVVQCGDLERAVFAARAAAEPGEIVLLSPACASFDQYPGGYEARGVHFKALVTSP